MEITADYPIQQVYTFPLSLMQILLVEPSATDVFRPIEQADIGLDIKEWRTITSANVCTVNLIIKDYVFVLPPTFSPQLTATIVPTPTSNPMPTLIVMLSPSNNIQFGSGFIIGALTVVGIVIILGFGIFIGIMLKK